MSEQTVRLTKQECANLLDALGEWMEVIGPKELEANEEGLDAERYDAIVKKLTMLGEQA
jgi:hypothetical protein